MNCIIKITTDELRQMRNSEGLVLQGCGGDLQQWIDGINKLLTDEKILLDGTRFSTEGVRTFDNEGLTNLLFLFEPAASLDMGRLAIWRLKTHEMFGGTWLSDYVENRLGGFEDEPSDEKPDCQLVGQDGNIFAIMATASRALRRSGASTVKEMCDRVYEAVSYDEAIGIISEYVNIK